MSRINAEEAAAGVDLARQAQEGTAAWNELLAQYKVEMDRGTDPADPKVQALEKRRQALVSVVSGGDKAIMKSGEGKIIYSSSGPMTVVAKKPPSAGAITAETANSAYGELPVGPSQTFTQTFTVVPAASR